MAKECPFCKEGGYQQGDLVKDICPKCLKKGHMEKYCHACRSLIGEAWATCPKCGSDDIDECFVQVYRLTPKGEKAVDKLQVEALLSEVANEGG